jgi:hypothetical protein
MYRFSSVLWGDPARQHLFPQGDVRLQVVRVGDLLPGLFAQLLRRVADELTEFARPAASTSRRSSEDGDHFLLRRSLKLARAADHDWPARESIDARGLRLIERWSWIVAAAHARSRPSARYFLNSPLS